MFRQEKGTQSKKRVSLQNETSHRLNHMRATKSSQGW